MNDLGQKMPIIYRNLLKRKCARASMLDQTLESIKENKNYLIEKANGTLFGVEEELEQLIALTLLLVIENAELGHVVSLAKMVRENPNDDALLELGECIHDLRLKL